MLEYAIENGRWITWRVEAEGGSLNGVRVMVVLDACRTSPLVKI